MAAKFKERKMTGFLTPTQASHILAVSKQRIHRLIAEGRLPCLMTPLGRLIEVREVERLKRERKKTKAKAA
jgi:excisionase family DNA binding protein